MSVTDASHETVTLTGGVVVPLAALQFLWKLEDRGLRFQVDGEDIIVSPRTLLTDDDRLLLRNLKPAIREIVRYCGEMTL